MRGGAKNANPNKAARRGRKCPPGPSKTRSGAGRAILELWHFTTPVATSQATQMGSRRANRGGDRQKIIRGDPSMCEPRGYFQHNPLQPRLPHRWRRDRRGREIGPGRDGFAAKKISGAGTPMFRRLCSRNRDAVVQSIVGDCYQHAIVSLRGSAPAHSPPNRSAFRPSTAKPGGGGCHRISAP